MLFESFLCDCNTILNNFNKCTAVVFQGHKHAKTDASGEAYEIVRKAGKATDTETALSAATASTSSSAVAASASASASGSGGNLKTAASMFSLKTNKSLRLRKWGSWIEYVDQQTNNVYWYNHRTGEGQFEMPAKVAALKASSSSPEDAARKVLIIDFLFRDRVDDCLDYRHHRHHQHLANCNRC